MRYFRDLRDGAICPCPSSGHILQHALTHTDIWEEVADAAGNPLPSVGVGTTSTAFRHTTRGYCPSCGCGSWDHDGAAKISTCTACNKQYTYAFLEAWWDQHENVTLPTMKPKVDEKEEALRAKVIPPFRGEERCSPPKPPQGYPREPYFHDNPERNSQSERVVRRFLTTNMREWATCRFTREPLELRFEGATMKDDPYGGEFARPVFFCPHCGVYGK